MQILTATLTETDAWGRPRTVEIKWVPQDVTDLVDPARRNIRAMPALIAHSEAGDPPVRLYRSIVDGGVRLETVVQQWKGEFAHTTEFFSVDREADLGPGSYVVSRDSEN